MAALLIMVFALGAISLPSGLAWASGQVADGVGALKITGNITDTENLLGNNLPAVTDAIAKTKHEDGVTVRLLYLQTFGDKSDPASWAGHLLTSLNPDPNTILLAVASGDGNLVVAVSPNSDEWLRSKATVDKLSDAALKPINQSSPDWSGSAIAMMRELTTLKKTSTPHTISRLGALGLVGALLLIALVSLLLVLLHRGRGKGGRAKNPEPAGRSKESECSAMDASADRSAQN
ncbi:hypothetical protein CRD60_00620 [Bifidobacterium aemilianum]|uniref:TPM domain-containing protein n=1 Tax=Bifidobacterium aemilianum TaxID=2493120 RepID=A0A366KAM8_9BIFI|nr:hypothetical protein CRD60_00620 [Bifidobacterium aemilianum]